jgi:homoserine kinase type II
MCELFNPLAFMAVFTEVSESSAQDLLTQLKLGELVELKGIQGGIENTNYFLTSSEGQFVLTLFERLTHAQLPFYLYLMKHLAQGGIPVPDPVSDKNGDILLTVEGKPATVVSRLQGKSELNPTPAQCAAVGGMLARMHLAGADYKRQQANLRGLSWWNDTVPVVLPFLNASQTALIQTELAYQNHIAASSAYTALPRGPIHADLFRDNVMFDGPAEALELSGFFDFYFAGVDTWLFDVAVCLNDWCTHHTEDTLADGIHDATKAQALLAAYQAVRPFSAPERQLLNPMLRAGALRFWTSRLWDFHLPRQASMLQPHDPTHFERVLRQRVAQPVTL